LTRKQQSMLPPPTDSRTPVACLPTGLPLSVRSRHLAPRAPVEVAIISGASSVSSLTPNKEVPP
jgi:hypothetical protein